MAKTFQIQITTPERVVYDREAISLIAPAYDGYLGVKANHAPLAAELKVGHLVVTRPNGQKDFLAVSGGLLVVSGNVVTILADAAELAEEIDLARAQAAEARARERLRRSRHSGEGEEVDEDRARAALLRAANRLAIAKKRL